MQIPYAFDIGILSLQTHVSAKVAIGFGDIYASLDNLFGCKERVRLVEDIRNDVFGNCMILDCIVSAARLL